MSEVETNISTKFEILYDTLENLCSFLDEENDSLKNHDFQTVSENINHKQKLTKLYIEMVRGVAANPANIANLENDERNVFKDKALELDEKMKVNKTLLKANMDANKKVIKAIVNTANREIQKDSHAYSARGHLGTIKKGGGETAFAFNETL